MDSTHVDDPIEVGDSPNTAAEPVETPEATGVAEPVEAEPAPAEQTEPVAEQVVVPAEETSEEAVEEPEPQPEPKAETRPSSEAVEVPVRIVDNGIAQRLPVIEPQPAPEPKTQPEPAPAPQPEPAPAPQPDPAPVVEPTPEPTPEPQPVLTVDAWVAKDRLWRLPELAAQRASEVIMEPTVGDNNALTRPFKVGDNYFLLYYSARFPSRDWGGDCPVKVYLVSPSVAECKLPRGPIPFVLKADDKGSVHISDQQFERAYQRLFKNWNSRMSATMARAALDLAHRWTRSLAQWSAEANRQLIKAEKPQLVPGWGKNAREEARPQTIPATGRTADTLRLGRSSFVDGRVSRGLAAPEACQKVVFSSRAFAQIYTETQARISTETGGLLLGHFHQGVWYVVETCDPGWNGVFQVAYHEGDEQYENHVSRILSRIYKHPLVFLGMWHRHPGSLDTFSGTDDVTNWRYVDHCTGVGCISGLINYDPDFRMTFYHCTQTDAPGMRYTRVDIEVGDDKFVMPELLQMATKADVDARGWR